MQISKSATSQILPSADVTQIVPKKIELHFTATNAFFLVAVIFQNYREERFYGKSFNLLLYSYTDFKIHLWQPTLLVWNISGNLCLKMCWQDRGFIKFLCRRSVGFYNRAFLVFLMKESKRRRRKQPGKLMEYTLETKQENALIRTNPNFQGFH